MRHHAALAAAPRRQRRGASTPAVAAAGRYTDAASAAGSVVVEVCDSEAAVKAYLCAAVEAAAGAAIAERGVFTLAIPGGSVLKTLRGLAGSSIPWDKVRLFFVNHKTVPNEDAATSSYAKARAIFLDAVAAPLGCVATLAGSDDAEVRREGAGGVGVRRLPACPPACPPACLPSLLDNRLVEDPALYFCSRRATGCCPRPATACTALIRLSPALPCHAAGRGGGLPGSAAAGGHRGRHGAGALWGSPL